MAEGRGKAARPGRDGGTGPDARAEAAPAARRRPPRARLPAASDLEREDLLAAHLRLAIAQERFQALLAAVPLPLVLVDQRGTLQDANAAAAAWLGEPSARRGVPGRQLLKALDRKRQAELLQRIDGALQAGDAIMRDVELTTTGGVGVLVDAHIHRLPIVDEPPAFVMALVPRRDGADAIRTHDMVHQMLGHSHALIYCNDLAGTLIFSNIAASGAPASAAEGDADPRHGMLRFALQSLKQKAAEERAVRERLPVEFRDEIHSLPGVPSRIISTRKLPILDRAGDCIAVGTVITDITDDDRMHQSYRMSDIVFRCSSDAIIITDRNAHIVRVNRAFEQLTGFSQASVQGRKVSVLHSGLHSKSFYRDMWTTLAARGRWVGELTNRNAHGELLYVLATISVLVDDDGRIVGYMAVETNVTPLRKAQARIDRLANFDTLTGLPNRDLLNERLDDLIRVSGRREEPFSLLFVDLDHFKNVNDSLGHAAGDKLLTCIADRLTRELRDDDTVARIGGDEFVVLLPGCDGASVRSVGQKLVEALHAPVTLPRFSNYRPSVSVGAAVFPQHGSKASDLMTQADAAMYAAKAAGRNRIMLYDETMGLHIRQEFWIRNEMPAAMEQGHLQLHLQPKFDLATGRIIGAEGLVRWARNGTLMLPGEFLWAIERNALLNLLGEWVLAEAVRLLADWTARGILPPGFSLSINQVASDIAAPKWLRRLRRLIGDAGIPPSSLEVELSESMLAHADPHILETLRGLRDLGVALSIDDFGTGYSNLANLQRVPANTIKIDQSFVRNMVDAAEDRVLLEAIVSLARKLGHRTLAEGVETEDQRRMLAELGCDWGQGYLVSRAVHRRDFESRFLARADTAAQAAIPDPARA